MPIVTLGLNQICHGFEGLERETKLELKPDETVFVQMLLYMGCHSPRNIWSMTRVTLLTHATAA